MFRSPIATSRQARAFNATNPGQVLIYANVDAAVATVVRCAVGSARGRTSEYPPATALDVERSAAVARAAVFRKQRLARHELETRITAVGHAVRFAVQRPHARRRGNRNVNHPLGAISG